MLGLGRSNHLQNLRVCLAMSDCVGLTSSDRHAEEDETARINHAYILYVTYSFHLTGCHTRLREFATDEARIFVVGLPLVVSCPLWLQQVIEIELHGNTANDARSVSSIV